MSNQGSIVRIVHAMTTPQYNPSEQPEYQTGTTPSPMGESTFSQQPPAYGDYVAQSQSPQGMYVPPQGVYVPPEPQYSWNVMCIVGFVLSFLLSPVGLILSIIALVQINKSHQKSKGMAIAGIVIGALFTVISIIVCLLVVWAVNTAINHPELVDTRVCVNGECTVCVDGECSTYSQSDLYVG